MEGWGWQSVHDPELLPKVLEKWSESIATGASFEMIFPLRGADSTFQPFLTRVNSIRDAQGKVLRWVGTNVNISSQVEAETIAAEKDKRLRAAFHQTYSFMILLGVDGTILDANDAALQAIARQREEVIGQKVWESAWWSGMPNEVEVVKKSIARAANGETVREECAYGFLDGEIRYAERTLNPVKEKNGEITMVVASGLDITERKELREKLEERVRDRTKDLEEKHEQLLALSGRLLRSQDEERRRLARDLHDSIGQLLAAVGMNLNVVFLQADRLTPEAAAALYENDRLVQQISSEIRTISHLLHPPLLEELGILTSLRTYSEGFAERSKIKVTLDFPANLDDVPQSMGLAIFRIVQECLTNVYRHSRSLVAFIRIRASTSEISVQVRDEGRGIPLETRAAATSGKVLGVGLSGMRERVREFGGTLDVQSSDAGTSVTATLPLPLGAKNSSPSTAEAVRGD